MNIFKDDHEKRADDHLKKTQYHGNEALRSTKQQGQEIADEASKKTGDEIQSAKKWAQESGKEIKSGLASTLDSAKENLKAVPSALKKGARAVKEKLNPKDENDK